MAMDPKEASNLLFDHFICGCGDPVSGLEWLLDLLNFHPLYENQKALQDLLPDIGQRQLALGQLDCADLTEHGGTIEGAWLTEKGTALRDCLRAEAPNEFRGILGQELLVNKLMECAE